MNYEARCASFNQLSVSELYGILQLRSDVFVIEQQCLYQDIDSQDRSSIHMWLEDEAQKVLAYLRIIPKGVSHEKVVIGRVVVHCDYRKHGLARILLNKSFKWVNDYWGDEPIKISAQTYLIDFYVSLGFSPISEAYLEDGIEHIDMLRAAHSSTL